MNLFNIFNSGPSEEEQARMDEEKRRREEKHEERLAMLNAANEKNQEEKYKQLEFLQETTEKDYERRAQMEQDMNNAHMKMIQDQRENIEKIQAESINRLAALQEDANAQKAKERDRQQEEKREIMKNHTDQLLEAEKTKSKFNLIAEERLADERKLIFNQKETMAGEKKSMVDKSLENEQNNMEKRLAAEKEKKDIALETQQIVTNFDVRQARLEEFHQQSIAGLIISHGVDSNKSIHIRSLREIKNRVHSMKQTVNELFNKFDVPLQVQSVVGMKKAARRSQININELNSAANSLEIGLQSLQGDIEQKQLANEALEYLTDFGSILSTFEEYMENKESISGQVVGKWIDCLNKLVKSMDDLKQKIEIIPDFDNDSDFMGKCLQLTNNISGMFNSGSAIEAGNVRIEQIENLCDEGKKEDVNGVEGEVSEKANDEEREN